ncbi:hypothetical protein J7L27_01810 [Candidatus Bathyarchaeota archaeon]|nr:hypothetical protein [Candidatus Bathyarchaeota archaeon]
MSRKRFNRRGLSPVIATVILVAVTIVVAVAIAYWMGGIAGLYTRYEELKITYANPVRAEDLNYGDDGTFDGWNITLKVKNTGSASATIDDILLNGVSITNVNNGTTGAVIINATVFYGEDNVPAPNKAGQGNSTISITVNGGEEIYLLIIIPDGAQMGSSTASSGLSLEIKLHTAAGREYPKLISLP